jgi:uncharacterized protein (DUF2384 family)
MAAIMVTPAKIAEALGGYRVMKGHVRSAGRLRERVHTGLPYSAVEALAERLEATAAELAEVLGVPARTLARRRGAGRLTAAESDRLVRLGRIAALAEEVLGDRALGGYESRTGLSGGWSRCGIWTRISAPAKSRPCCCASSTASTADPRLASLPPRAQRFRRRRGSPGRRPLEPPGNGDRLHLVEPGPRCSRGVRPRRAVRRSA